MSKVSICLVTWNGEKFINNCLDSLLNQSYEDFSIQILDNGSMDKTREILAKDYPQILVEKKDRNLGFAKAYNQLMLRSKSDYVLIVNQDMVFAKDFLKEMVNMIEQNENIGVVGPCLYRLIDFEKSEVIDSLGLKIFKNYQVVDTYAGEKDVNVPERFEVFGISGAVALFRKKALESVRFENEYFDNDFFAYKEDVDLAMRLRLKKWKAFINMKAVAYHARTAKENKKISLLKQYRQKSDFVKFYSFRNQKLFILKTAQWSKYGLFILFSMFKRSLFVLLFSPRIWWRVQVSYFKLRRRILKKRKKIVKYIKKRNLSKWFNQ